MQATILTREQFEAKKKSTNFYLCPKRTILLLGNPTEDKVGCACASKHNKSELKELTYEEYVSFFR